MNRMPLSDQIPYRFVPPRHNPFCLALSRLAGRWKMRVDQGIEAVELSGEHHLRSLIARGDGILLTPNHTDHADGYLMVDLGHRVGRPFCYMVAYQVLQGLRGRFLNRLGSFPIDREGTDLQAFKTAVDVLVKGKHPLVIFPEGEIHHLGDRLTPLREGAVAVATTAVKRLNDSGKTIWIVPVAIKYRFVDSFDPLPALHDLMDELERRAHWWVDRERPMVQRIYRFAEGMMTLKELEYSHPDMQGTLPERLTRLRERILTRIEAKRIPEGRRRAGSTSSVPERVKELRHVCLERLSDPATTPEEARALRHDLHDVFVAFQTFSYTGDYLRETPTLERVAETLMKFEEDFLGIHEVKPKGPRRAILHLGEPIDVRARLAEPGVKPRQVVSALTSELEGRIQSLLDAIGPGRPLRDSGPSSPNPARVSEPPPGSASAPVSASLPSPLADQ